MNLHVYIFWSGTTGLKRVTCRGDPLVHPSLHVISKRSLTEYLCLCDGIVACVCTAHNYNHSSPVSSGVTMWAEPSSQVEAGVGLRERLYYGKLAGNIVARYKRSRTRGL